MSIVSFRPVASRRTADGFILAYPFFLPVKVLSRVFRGKFVAGLKRAVPERGTVPSRRLKALAGGKAFHAFLRTLFRQDWVVYAKPPFGGPEHVLHYLARYTHRVAISNHRLVQLCRWPSDLPMEGLRPRRQKRKMTLAAEEFLRRFLLHVLPKGFVRIRFFGLFANRRRRGQLAQCQQLLATLPETRSRLSPAEPTSTWLCPLCGGKMVVYRVTRRPTGCRSDQRRRELLTLRRVPSHWRPARASSRPLKCACRRAKVLLPAFWRPPQSNPPRRDIRAAQPIRLAINGQHALITTPTFQKLDPNAIAAASAANASGFVLTALSE